MSKTLKVLFLAAEADPFVKVGGLGDVAGSLPRALRALSPELTGEVLLDVRLVLPFHPVIRSNITSLHSLPPFTLRRNGEEILVEVFETILEEMPVYFIGGGPIDASGSVYSSNSETDGEKYTFFSLAALGLAKQLNWYPDVVHANDWHTALTAYGLLVQHWQEGQPRPASLITVHNLPFLGPDVHNVLEKYDIPLAQTDLPDWARLKPLPLGLWSADAIVAVSPTYADEMLSKDYGSGLQDFLKTRRENLTGILNGLDVNSFDPTTDKDIAAQFTAESLDQRKANKTALATQVGLVADQAVPLFGVVSRMDPQKGIDLVLDGLRRIVDTPWQAVVLGTGDPKLEESARKLQKDFSERVRIAAKYDSRLARQIYAGADIFLMPSRYEPCGLSQMIAMRYGCVPVVRAVGGLHDTVTEGETGFVFIKPQVKDFVTAVQRALDTYRNKEAWQAMQKNGMRQDFSWTKSASKYFELYQRLISTRT
ncbi:MAG: glycogen synthase [Anaerolineales bacterium]|nr:glycogen synthase [Anaerolineales bacterium]